MKQKKNRTQARAFLGGAAATLLVCALVTTSLAVTGAVRFDPARVSFNTASVSYAGETIFSQDESLRGENGAEIPSTLLYTDELGGGTTYVPIRFFAPALNLGAGWSEADSTLQLWAQVNQDPAASSHIGSEYYLKVAEEVDPFVAPKGKTLLDQRQYTGSSVFEQSFSMDLKDGDYFTVTVANNGPAPLDLLLGFGMTDSNYGLNVQVPAGGAVTRTVRLLPSADLVKNPIFVKLAPADGPAAIDAAITAVQSEAV